MDVLRLANGRAGHFVMESGFHSALWFELDSLFSDGARVRPFVSELAERLRGYAVDGVCGPLLGGAFLAQRLAEELGVWFAFTERRMPDAGTGLYRAAYVLPAALRPLVARQRVAIVDDVVSAGSAVRGTEIELTRRGARPVVVGALAKLGNAAEPYLRERALPIEAVETMAFDAWEPGACPLCAAHVPLEDPAEREQAG